MTEESVGAAAHESSRGEGAGRMNDAKGDSNRGVQGKQVQSSKKQQKMTMTNDDAVLINNARIDEMSVRGQARVHRARTSGGDMCARARVKQESGTGRSELQEGDGTRA